MLYIYSNTERDAIYFLFFIFLCTVQDINKGKLTYVLCNEWHICALGNISKSWFTRKCFAIFQHWNNPTQLPPFLLHSLFPLTSIIFIRSFTCKCPHPPPSHQEISKAMRGRQRLQPIPIEWCSASS